MTFALRFRDHDRFHKSALAMAGAGAAAGLAAALPGAATAAIPLAAGAAVFAAAAAEGKASPADIVFRALWVALGGAALIFFSSGSASGALVAFGILAALPLCWGARGTRLAVALGTGAAAMALAAYAHSKVLAATELASLPGWAVSTIGGAVFASVSVFALLHRHVEVKCDRVAQSYGGLNGRLNGEMADLVNRGHGVWSVAARELDEGDANRELLEEAVLRLFDTASRWQDADADRASERVSSLTERMESLSDRIDSADDEVVVAQYEQARSALAEQLKYISGISRNRDRVLARLHNYLAAMERLHMAVVNLKSANASRDAVDLAPIVANLEELGQDIDSCSSALGELDSETLAENS